MDAQILKVEARSVTGRKVKTLRKEGFLPGNVFGKGLKSEAIQLSLKDFEKVYKEAGETGLIELKIGTKTRPVLVSNLQINPVSDLPIHVDFRQVDLKEKVAAKVAVEMEGEAPAEKSGVGTAVLYINEIEVEALPTDLPDKFSVDISALAEVDQAILIKDLKVDRTKVTLKAEEETIVVKVEPPQKEEVVAPPAPAEGEVSAEGEGALPAEGETPVEGGPASAETAAGKEAPKEEKPQ